MSLAIRLMLIVCLAFPVLAIGCGRAPEPAGPKGNMGRRFRGPSKPEVSPETINRVVRLIGEQLGVSAEKLNATTSLGQLGADELDYVELIMELEEEFSISIPEQAEEKLLDESDLHASMNRLTVQRLAEIVEELMLKAKSATNEP